MGLTASESRSLSCRSTVLSSLQWDRALMLSNPDREFLLQIRVESEVQCWSPDRLDMML